MLSSGEPKKILIISQIFFSTEDKDYKIKESIVKLAEQGHDISIIARKSSSDTIPEIKKRKLAVEANGLMSFKISPLCGKL